MNGIFNALVSRLLFTLYILKTGRGTVSYREIIYNLLAFFVLLPSLLILAISSRGDFRDTEQLIRKTVAGNAMLIEHYMEIYLGTVSLSTENGVPVLPYPMKILLDRAASQKGLQYTVADPNNLVLLTNCPEQTMLRPYKPFSGSVMRIDETISRLIPPLPPNTPASERWRKSLYFAEITTKGNPVFRVVLGQPVAPFQKLLFERYSARLFMLFGLLTASLLLAELISRRIINTIERLAVVSRHIPMHLANGPKSIGWPESRVLESEQLIANFREMTDSLYSQFAELERQSTELKLANESLAKAKNEAEGLAVARGRFLDTVAHEFRTPLALLSSSTDIINRYGERLDSKGLEEQKAHIRSAIQQLSGLIEAAISFNRLESGRLKPQPELIDVQDTCSRIADEVIKAWGFNQSYRLEAEGSQLKFFLDRTLFSQIISNLLTNAFKYSNPDGEVVLRLWARDNILRIEVEDKGIGIPDGEMAGVFKPFCRGNNVGTRRGLGLGLSIVQEALNLMSGRIFITSKTGEGTKVQIEIPAGDNQER